jgi:hypothetical protein
MGKLLFIPGEFASQGSSLTRERLSRERLSRELFLLPRATIFQGASLSPQGTFVSPEFAPSKFSFSPRKFVPMELHFSYIGKVAPHGNLLGPTHLYPSSYDTKLGNVWIFIFLSVNSTDFANFWGKITRFFNIKIF